MDATYRLERGITLTRLFDAPPDVVFDAWTRPEALGWFFNPDNPTDIPAEVDLRVGGEWRQM
ncbi:MAG: SRPBCC family protein, partial [Devosia sp.]